MENLEKNKGAFIDEDINKQVEAVYDELKSYIDDLICCDKTLFLFERQGLNTQWLN